MQKAKYEKRINKIEKAILMWILSLFSFRVGINDHKIRDKDYSNKIS